MQHRLSPAADMLAPLALECFKARSGIPRINSGFRHRGVPANSGLLVNGLWIRRPKGPLAIVVIHGLLSDRGCWTHSNGTYWPTLLAEEKRLASAGIYVFEYKTGFFSGTYRLGDVVDALRTQLRLDSVLNCDQLVFVCHSMGGLVARRYIVQNALTLLEHKKEVGVFLIASPSLGAEYANWLAPLARAARHTQADALRFAQTNSWLLDLDSDFKNLNESGRLNLRGKELVEDTFVILPRWFGLPQVVEPFSGARYFGDALKIPNSDHFSIPTVADASAIQHRLLVEFLLHYSSQANKSHQSKTTGFGGNGQKGKLLSFQDEVHADPVSIKLAVEAFRNGGRQFEIGWPHVTSECLGHLRRFVIEAENYRDPESVFHAWSPDSVASFMEDANNAVKRADHIRISTPKRISMLIKGMEKHWGKLPSVEDALANYLALSNVRAMHAVLYYLRHRLIYSDYFPKQFEYWYEPLNMVDVELMPKIFSFDGPAYMARVYELCGESLESGGEYFWGPAWMIMDAVKRENQERGIANPWFAKYLIPQNELRLAEKSSEQQFVYNEVAKINKVLDRNVTVW